MFRWRRGLLSHLNPHSDRPITGEGGLRLLTQELVNEGPIPARNAIEWARERIQPRQDGVWRHNALLQTRRWHAFPADRWSCLIESPTHVRMNQESMIQVL